MNKKLVLSSIALAASLLVAASLPSYYEGRQMKISRDASASSTDILSFMSCTLKNVGAHQVATAETPNPEPYLALVDFNKCWPGGSASSDSESTPAYEKYWVDASYTDGALQVKLWEFSNSERVKYTTANIRNGAADAPPYGDWTANVCVDRLSNEAQFGSDPCAKKGYFNVSEGQTYDLYYRTEQSGTIKPHDQLAHGRVDASKTSGRGKYFIRSNDSQATIREGMFDFADGALLDNLNGNSTCKNPSASATGARRAIWEAWLYDPSTLEPVIANAGFPVRKVGTTYVGWAGSEGIRLDGSSSAEQSGTFVRLDGVEGQYTAFGSYGKLHKISNSLMPNGLKDIDGLVLKTRLYKDAFPNTLFTEDKPSRQQSVLFYWDHASSKFVFFAHDKSPSGDVGRSFVNYASPFSFTVTELLERMRSSTLNNDGNPRIWERKLWGFQVGSNNNYVIQLADEDRTLTWPERSIDNIFVTRQLQTQVVPGSDDAPKQGLICLGKCPRPVEGNSKLVLEQQSYFATDDLRTTQTYTFDNDTGALTIDGKKVQYSPEDSYIDRTTNDVDASRDYLWLNHFVTAEQLTQLKCHQGNDYCAFDTRTPEDNTTNGNETLGVDALSYSYAWSTGNNRWERFNGVRDQSGAVVDISAPMNLVYEVPNDESEFGTYAGKKASAKYLGGGQLWLPGHCENIADPSADVSDSCSNQGSEVWVTDVVIPTTTEAAGRVRDFDGAEYLVKWRRQGVLFPTVDDSVCSNAGLSLTEASTFVLPEYGSWTNPKPVIGALPDIPTDQQPRFIDGVAQ